MLRDFSDFAWLEQPEGNIVDAISRVWYNGSYTIAAKPIKTLELQYTIIQILIKAFIPCSTNMVNVLVIFLGLVLFLFYVVYIFRAF